jgi:hypothetical protein
MSVKINKIDGCYSNELNDIARLKNVDECLVVWFGGIVKKIINKLHFGGFIIKQNTNFNILLKEITGVRYICI